MRTHPQKNLVSVRDLYLSKKKVTNLYVHLPFCLKKCHFCAFPIHAIGRHDQNDDHLDKYVHHVVRQIQIASKYWNVEQQLQSVYFGGGTPSLYHPSHISQIISCFPPGYTPPQITVEMNPSEIQKLPLFQQIGVNRFSVGIQSFNQKVLDKMNRFCSTEKQRLKQVLCLSKSVKLSLDFILDFCVEEADFREMMNFIQQLQPRHITLYMLEVNEGSYLERKIKEFDWLPKQNVVVGRYIQASHLLSSLGYDHYEVSSFSKGKNYQSRHNKCYWEGNKQFLGFGMGAASLLQSMRVTRPPNLSKYYQFVKFIEENNSFDPVEWKVEVCQQKNALKELESVLMSGLRTAEGVAWAKIQLILGPNFVKMKQEMMEIFKEIDQEQKGLINWELIDKKVAVVIPKGYLFADEISFRILHKVQLTQTPIE